MSGIFDKQADIYAEVRLTYPKEWYCWLAQRTPQHSLAWDVGTGNGQAAISVAEHYDQVIATDISEPQISRAIQHPKVKYIYTPQSLSNNDLISLIGLENSFDLITVAQAVHWFDLPNFYSVANRLLKKPGGVIAVWCYHDDVIVSPAFDSVMDRLLKTTLPYWDPRTQYVFDMYKTLPFPFDEVGLGREGQPMEVDIPKMVSFEGFLGILETWPAVATAEEKGVKLLNECVVKELMDAWGGSNVVKSVVYKAFMIAGKVRA